MKQLPKGWKIVKLGDVIDFSNGKRPSKNRGNFKIFGGNGVAGMTDNYNSEGESIIIGRVGAYCGNVYYSKEKIWISDNAILAKPKSGNSRFIYYLLKSLNLNNYALGSSHPLLTQEVLKSLYTKIPIKIPEQRGIAEVLSSLDDKIDLLHRQNQTLEQLAETLFRQYFIENPEKEKWEKGTLSDEFEIIMGQSPPGHSYNNNHKGIPLFQGNADFGFRFPKNRVYTTEPKRIAQKYDTLISVRAPVGEINMAKEQCCIGRGLAAIRYKSNPSLYTYTYFKIKSLMKEIKKFDQTGTVFGSITKKELENISNIIPPQKVIIQFIKAAKSIDDKIINNCFQIRTLEQLRDTLLPKLISGEVRVKI